MKLKLKISWILTLIVIYMVSFYNMGCKKEDPAPIVAEFVYLQYTAGVNGSIDGISPQSVEHGASGSPVTAVPNTGYRFNQWGDGSTQNPRTDTNVTQDIVVEAEFIIGPLFVFGFDDGNESDYYHAYRELKLRGLRGTSFTHTSAIGEPGRLTWELIHEMVNDGWEMGCHTHSHIRLTEATEQEIRDEFEMVNALYKARDLPIPRHLTYPWGAWYTDDGIVKRIVSEYRLSARTGKELGTAVNFSDKNFDFMSYGWVHADMLSQNHLNNAKNEVDLAFQEHTALVSFLIHGVVESKSEPSTYYECLLIYLQELLDYIIDLGGTIVTMDEAYEIIKSYRQNLDL